jgi:hypothetical protein
MNIKLFILAWIVKWRNLGTMTGAPQRTKQYGQNTLQSRRQIIMLGCIE